MSRSEFGFGAKFMEVLIVLRDVIVAVLLSWVGIDAPEEKTDNNREEKARIYLSSDEVICDDEVFKTDA